MYKTCKDSFSPIIQLVFTVSSLRESSSNQMLEMALRANRAQQSGPTASDE